MTRRDEKSRRWTTALVAALLLLATACGGGGGDAGDTQSEPADEPTDTASGNEGGGDGERERIVVAAASLGIPFMQLFAAEEAGIYDEHNIDVEILEVQGSANATAAVESGQADLMVSLPEGVIQARSQGSTLKMIGATVNESLYRFYAQPEIQSLDDLAGQNIAMLVEGNGTHIQAQWLLDTHGPGQETATYVATGGLGDRLAALQAKQVAASLLFPPFDVQAENAGLHPLAVMADYVDGYPNEVFAATEATLESRGDALRSFMAAMVDASQWLVDNPEEAIQLAVDRFSGDPDTMRQAFEFTAPFYALDGAVPEEGLQWTLDVMEEYAGLADPPAIDELYDPSFLPAG